ncbi:putative protein kinase YGL059W [Sarracenia purpurea var. burkii]
MFANYGKIFENFFRMQAMVTIGDLGAELPIEEDEIIMMCRSIGKAVIVATNMLESMIVHPTPSRAEVSDIAIAVREGADAVILFRSRLKYFLDIRIIS